MKVAVTGTLLALVNACSPGPVPISQSSRDPASPSAPEGVTPAVAASAMPTSAQLGGETSTHDHHGDAHSTPDASMGHHARGAGPASSGDGGTHPVVYVCPMHPEVTSTTPGSLCPKCNMKLVPKK